MRNNFWFGFGFAVFTLLALFSVVISVITFQHHNQVQNTFFGFLATNHLWIMLATIFLALGYGFVWSYVLTKKVMQEEKNTKGLFQIILSFLGEDEQKVLKHLVENSGKSTQAAIARIEGMGGVKALRTIQKMKDKNLVHIEKEGKMRRIELDERVFSLLNER